MKCRIRDLREDNNLSQKEIASLLFCDTSLYSKYERKVRDIPLSYVIKLAAYYKVSIDYLVGVTDEPKRYAKSKIKS